MVKRGGMLLSPLVAVLTSLSLQSADPGSAKLRTIFEKYSKMRGLEAVVARSYREKDGGPFFPDRQMTLWYDGPSRFRILGTSVWGDATLYIADGKDLYIDPLDDNRPATIREMGGKTLMTSSGELRGGDGVAFVYYLLEGPSSLQRLLAPGSSVKELAGGALQFQSRDMGTVTVYPNSQKLVERVEYDNLPTAKALYRLVPMWVDRPQQPLQREDMDYVRVGERLPKGLFDTKPPKGRRVTDQRKKKSAIGS